MLRQCKTRDTYIQYSHRILKTPDQEGYAYMSITIPKVIKHSKIHSKRKRSK